MNDGGDLKEITSANENLSSYQGNSTRYTKFSRFTHQLGLVDVGFSSSLLLGRTKGQPRRPCLKDWMEPY